MGIQWKNSRGRDVSLYVRYRAPRPGKHNINVLHAERGLRLELRSVMNESYVTQTAAQRGLIDCQRDVATCHEVSLAFWPALPAVTCPRLDAHAHFACK